jgi:outer membrane protein assembly complex protein YaeT
MARVFEITRSFGLRACGGFAARAFGLCPRAVATAFWLLVLAGVLFPGAAFANASAKPKPPKPAKLKVSGYGLLGNRELVRMLKTLELSGRKPDHFDSTFIEDSALLLAARVRRDGYLRPAIRIRVRLEQGGELQVDAEQLIENPLPRTLRATEVRFQIHEGVLYYYQNLSFEGLQTVTEKQARSYFAETDTLLRTKHGRIYTPEGLQHGLASISELLDRQGYHEARVAATKLERDDHTGAVTVNIRVQQGLKFMVHSVRVEYSDENVHEEGRTLHPNQPYSRLWLQDFSLSLKTNRFRLGYADAKVEIQTLAQRAETNQVQMDLLAKVQSGLQVRIGSVNFVGQKRTQKWLMARRAKVQRGELLDPVRVEEGRYRLARLGVFDRVDLDYQPVDEHTREVTYRVTETKSLNLSLLAGWGSYEMLRGGVEIEKNDIWGLAHHAELKAIQSFKSSSGDFLYTVPEAVGNDYDVFVNGSGLRREEVSFTRLEYGGGIGLHKFFPAAATDASLRYSYQILSALDITDVSAVAAEGLTNPAVGAVTFEVKHDRRDNPLYPRRGYKVFATLETATTYLGGDANYERIELFTSWHHPLGGGRYLSLGLSHGVDVSFGSSAFNLPFNKRFFPGGENSIRGYREGEASPRDASGQLVGAETYLLGTVELEQALTTDWSLVAFSDSLGMAQHLDHYPFDTGLFSVGGGVRWRTLIGPVRLEYGYNLNPRPGDPKGTLLFSLGFPF